MIQTERLKVPVPFFVTSLAIGAVRHSWDVDWQFYVVNTHFSQAGDGDRHRVFTVTRNFSEVWRELPRLRVGLRLACVKCGFGAQQESLNPCYGIFSAAVRFGKNDASIASPPSADTA